MSKDFRLIVRVMNTDVDGTLKVPYALARVKGIGVNLGYAISRVAGIDPQTRIGNLSEKQIEKIEQIAKNPVKNGIPAWMVNRRFDPITGENKHLIGADLELAVKEDIQTMMRTKSWKGIRHSLGLKVRGQRTRTTGRTGMTVGVSRKAAAAAG
ncbi:MAG: 30S ribosomal protein S13, partial [Candidatus Caldarchaeum sp.]|nr:30S ribosomal protein S13 [Candidatus Caldarchaeum sp.]MDW8435810.1 30S ribosomal protein S13 [Candidatus Caldarchaeum sp.]